MRGRQDVVNDLRNVGDSTPRNQLAMFLVRILLEVLLDIRDILKENKND